MSDESIREIPIDSIICTRYPFENMDIERNTNIDDLVSSIKNVGILNPLIVRCEITSALFGKEVFTLLAGRRRLRAARELGRKTVPVRIRNINIESMPQSTQDILIAAIENECRIEMNAIERAYMYHELIDINNLRGTYLASILGKTEGYISRHKALLTLPEHIIKAIQEGKISTTHGFKLLEIKHNPDLLKRGFEAALNGIPVHKLLGEIKRDEELDQNIAVENSDIEIEPKPNTQPHNIRNESLDALPETEEEYFNLDYFGSGPKKSVTEVRQYAELINGVYNKLHRSKKTKVILVMKTLEWLYGGKENPLEDIITGLED
jgi:ParB/RepB/Spo0J family partition protein